MPCRNMIRIFQSLIGPMPIFSSLDCPSICKHSICIRVWLSKAIGAWHRFKAEDRPWPTGLDCWTCNRDPIISCPCLYKQLIIVRDCRSGEQLALQILEYHLRTISRGNAYQRPDIQSQHFIWKYQGGANWGFHADLVKPAPRVSSKTQNSNGLTNRSFSHVWVAHAAMIDVSPVITHHIDWKLPSNHISFWIHGSSPVLDAFRGRLSPPTLLIISSLSCCRPSDLQDCRGAKAKCFWYLSRPDFRYSFRSCLSPNSGPSIRHLETSLFWMCRSKCTTLGVKCCLLFSALLRCARKTLAISLTQNRLWKPHLNTVVICR